MKKVICVLKKIKKNPKIIIEYIRQYGLLNIFSDKTCLKLLWRLETGRRLNLENPKGFNEKLQWLKLYDRRPEYTSYVDKILVREYVKECVGEKYLVPVIGVYDDPDQIDFSSLPDQFVIKCNHNSGTGMCVCSDKSKINIQDVKNCLRKELQKNFYYENREWPYKNVVPRLLCEQFLVDQNPTNTSGTLIDYKFHCFNGEPKFLYVGTDDISSGTKGELRLSFFDLDWKTPPFYRLDHKPISVDVKKPEALDEMIEVARKLSKGIPFVRVDLYWINNKVFFSEMTFFPGGGFGFFTPEEWEIKLGEWIKLPGKSR